MKFKLWLFRKNKVIIIFVILIMCFCSCDFSNKKVITTTVDPLYITDTTFTDTDDPAIWINKNKPEESLILGTDKGDSTGGIFVFDLKGKLVSYKCIYNLHRPNNIDVEYGFKFNNENIDIAVFTERLKKRIRVLAIPDFKFIDNGGIDVFVDEPDSLREPMGIALYKSKNNDVFVFVTRKKGPKTNYVYQYQLIDSNSIVKALFIRKFGEFSGKKEIEAIVVDDELGYVYYSDEGVGVRKYYADAAKGNSQLSIFAISNIAQDHEGLCIYNMPNGKGYIILSNQGANEFHIFNRKGSLLRPHKHRLLKIVKVKAIESDGCDIASIYLNSDFPKGIFVAMSTDKTFHYYRADDIIP